MAYTIPTTRSTGNKITASIWNTDLVDNIVDHESRLSAVEAGVLVYYSQTTQQSVLNTAAETSIESADFAANFFQDDSSNWNNLARFTIALWLDNNTGGAMTSTVRVKFGSATVLTMSGLAVGAGNNYVIIKGTINATAQSAQVLYIEDSNTGATAATRATATIQTSRIATAEDGSGAITMNITIEHSVASPNAIAWLDQFVIEGPVVQNNS